MAGQEKSPCRTRHRELESSYDPYNKQETELYNKEVIGFVMVSAGVLVILLLKHSVNKIHCFYLLAVNDFRINLGSSDIRVSHQLAGCIKVRTHCHHKCSECVAGSMISNVLVYSG